MKSTWGKVKGPFKAYLIWPFVSLIFFTIVNLGMYFISIRAGIVMSAILFAYVLVLLVTFLSKKSAMTDSLIEFASEYAQMQKVLLDRFVVPYGLLDESGKIIWLNNSFTGKRKLPQRNQYCFSGDSRARF